MIKNILFSLSLLSVVPALHADAFDGLNISDNTEATSTKVVLTPEDANTEITSVGVVLNPENETVPDTSIYRWIHKSISKIDGNNIIVEASAANLRTIPFLKTSEPLSKASRGDSFSLLGSENDFYKIKMGDGRNSLENAKFTIARVSLESGELNLRKNPDNKSKILTRIPNKAKVQLLSKSGSWYLVKYNDSLGYINTKYYKETDKKEEYWHVKSSISKSAEQIFKEIQTLKEQIAKMQNPSPSVLLKYSKLLNKSLVHVNEENISSTIYVILSSLEKAKNYSKENLSADEKQAQEDTNDFLIEFNSIDKQQKQAQRLLEEKKYEEALRFVKIAAHKTDFKNKENLALLEKVLIAAAENEANPSLRTRYIGEANFIHKSISGREVPLPYSEGNVGNNNQSNDPLASQTELEDSAKQADSLNKQGKFAQALKTLRAANKSAQQKSVRLRLFLSRQLFFMAKKSEFSNQAEDYTKEAEIELFEAREMTSKYLDEYPDNKRWEGTLSRTNHRPDQNPGISVDEKTLNEIIEAVVKDNRRLFYTRGKNKLLDLAGQTSQDSAKVHFYLSKQYMLLANNYKKLEFVQRASESLNQAIALKDKHLDIYTENNLWATQALEYKGQVDTALKTYEDGSTTSTNNNSTGQLNFFIPAHGRVSSKYGMRDHPIYRKRRMHGGLDISAARGTPVKAMANGKIVRARWGKGYGNTIDILYDNGYKSRFAHLKDYKGKNGDCKINIQNNRRSKLRVNKGDIVGHINSTGGSTGDHLHLEMFKPNGKRTSPGPLINRANRRGENI
ncbi:MAG: hypothetical protein COB02_02160 [Candidatus Cloacimonadota bacterium]|nr:MAG: hypothetical protein COB02_02160 [Candidatus Cloacimonadota bacterium]